MILSNRVLNLTKAIHNIIDEQFSGAIYIKDNNKVLFESAFGYANRADKKLNTVHTRFGIASGCKLFTAVAICQLVEKGLLSFETRLENCLNIKFPHFNKGVTIHHLLTHSSGIPDYFDEQVMDDFEDLWKQIPMYLLNEAKDFLPLFQNGEMMFQPGEKFHYNNAGFIVLGLIVEQQSGLSFTDYIEANLFQRCGMNDSGYFPLDRLPKNTAYGYIDNKDETWRTNTYSIPIKGGPDGGAFITPSDMIKFWEALLNHQLLSKEYTEILLNSQIHVKDGVDYGYGLWITKRENSIIKYHVMGYDPGVSFHSAFYPKSGIKIAIPSNKSSGSFEVMKGIEEIFEI
ncbi:serine hydrolase domain-containing protein [Bacillus sp. S10(2024)]|uniref:serine hydrolase domain-containing protein n=1 Tax=Bacillus sp. S10(2024) TaxID=3162886 RepID=UPI003D19BC2A